MCSHHRQLSSPPPIPAPPTQQGQVIMGWGLQGPDSLISINYSLCRILWKGEMGNHCRARKMLKVDGADWQQPKHPGWPQQGGVHGEKQQVGLGGVMRMFYPPPPHVVLLQCTFCKVKTNRKERKSAVLRGKKENKNKILAEG